MIGIGVLFAVPGFLVFGTAELTRPLPRKELWSILGFTVVFLAVALTSPFLHSPAKLDPQTHGMSYAMVLVVAAVWIWWMWAIYRRWQHEKVKVDAQACVDPLESVNKGG